MKMVRLFTPAIRAVRFATLEKPIATLTLNQRDDGSRSTNNEMI